MLSGTTKLVMFAITLSLLATLALRTIKQTASHLFSGFTNYGSGPIRSDDVLSNDIGTVNVEATTIVNGKPQHHVNHVRSEYESAKQAIEDSLRKNGNSLAPAGSQDVLGSRQTDTINQVIDNLIEGLLRNDVERIRSLATTDLKKKLTVTAIRRLLETAPASIRKDRILKVVSPHHIEVWTNQRLLTLIRTSSSEWKISQVW